MHWLLSRDAVHVVRVNGNSQCVATWLAYKTPPRPMLLLDKGPNSITGFPSCPPSLSLSLSPLFSPFNPRRDDQKWQAVCVYVFTLDTNRIFVYFNSELMCRGYAILINIYMILILILDASGLWVVFVKYLFRIKVLRTLSSLGCRILRNLWTRSCLSILNSSYLY